MLWESLIGIVVFTVLVLLLGPEWWSSSLGTLREKQKREQAEREKQEKKDETPPRPEG